MILTYNGFVSAGTEDIILWIKEYIMTQVLFKICLLFLCSLYFILCKYKQAWISQTQSIFYLFVLYPNIIGLVTASSRGKASGITHSLPIVTYSPTHPVLFSISPILLERKAREEFSDTQRSSWMTDKRIARAQKRSLIWVTRHML